MALQYVGGATAGANGSASTGVSVSLTALTGGISSSAAAGDIVLVYASRAGFPSADSNTSYPTIKDPAAVNYPNEITLAAVGSYSSYSRFAAKQMGGTPDASVEIGPSGHFQDALIVAVSVWRDADPTSIASGTRVHATNTSTSTRNADPPSVTPTVTGSVVVAFGAGGGGGDANYTSSDLSNFIEGYWNDTYAANIGTGNIPWTSGAVNPAAFSASGDSTSYASTALSIVLKPVVLTQNLTASLFTNSQTFYAPKLNLKLAPPLLTNTQVFYSATLVQGNSLQAPLLTNEQTFYSPTITPGSVTLLAPLLSNEQTFYSFALQQTLAAPLLANEQTFYTPRLLFSFALVTPEARRLSLPARQNRLTLHPSLLDNRRLTLQPRLRRLELTP